MSDTLHEAQNLRRLGVLRNGRRPGWPIDVIGKYEGLLVFRDKQGAVQAMPMLRLTRTGIAGMFDGDAAALARAFPAARGDGWDHHHASMQLMTVASVRGFVEPERLGLRAIYRRPRGGGTQRVMLIPHR